jgi:hypothetical protein
MKRLVKARKDPRATNPAKTVAFLKPRNVDTNRQAQGKPSVRRSITNASRLFFRQQNPQVVLANRAPGAEGKPTKGQSRPLIISNRQQVAPLRKTADYEPPQTRTTPRRSWENQTSARLPEKIRCFALLAEP